MTKSIIEQNLEEELDVYLVSSATFEEFYAECNERIHSHLLETTLTPPLEDTAKEYAKEIWDEYVDGQMPF